MSLSDGRVVGLEALVRWDHPERGLLFPSSFLGEAERTGLIVPLGQWVRDEACRQVAIWQRRARVRLTLAVNVSAAELVEPDFVVLSPALSPPLTSRQDRCGSRPRVT